MAANLTGLGPDDPEVTLHENFGGGSSRTFTTAPLFATILVLALSVSAVVAQPARHAGLVQSFVPSAGLMLVEEVGAGGAYAIIEVDVRDADVVRLWRDPNDPWGWKERPARIHRLPVGTFVVVVGHPQTNGVVDALRVEVPELD